MGKMQENSFKIDVLKSKDLTKTAEAVKSDLPKYWEKEYILNIIENTRSHKYRMIFTFLWMSGLRITETVNLRKGDIDFQNYVMKVRWLKSRKYNYRIVPLHPELRNLLQLYTAAMNNEELVFPITRQRAWQIVNEYFGGHPHQFRHSFAVNWLRCGGDIIILHRILGHSKIQTTMEYLKIVPTDQGKELLKISFR